MAPTIDDTSTKRAQDHIETLTRSLFQLHGYPAPDAAMVDRIVKQFTGLNGLQGLHNPENVAASMIGQIDQLVVGIAEVQRRPTNLYSAEAARQAQKGDGEPKGKHRSFTDPLSLSPSGARYQEMIGESRHSGLSVPEGGDTQKLSAESYWASAAGLATTRNYALGNDMAWATKQPDLMRLGQPAIQALHEAKLKGDGYENLHSPAHLNFDNPTIVAGAGYMKRNKADYNEAAKKAAALDALKQMSPEERALHREAEKKLLTSKPGQSEVAAKQRYYEMGDKLKAAHAGDAAVDAKVEDARRAHHVQKGIEHKAAVKVQATDAQATTDQKANQSSLTNFSSLLKSAPKGP